MRENTQMCPKVELFTYCSMNKQYVEELENKKGLLDKCGLYSYMVLLFTGRDRDYVSTVQRTEAIKVKKEFLGF